VRRHSRKNNSFAKPELSMNIIPNGSVEESLMIQPTGFEQKEMQAVTVLANPMTAFHFGSGRQYSTSAKQTKCIIHRSQMEPALFGRRARKLSTRLAS
jgi:hypothetical protein